MSGPDPKADVATAFKKGAEGLPEGQSLADLKAKIDEKTPQKNQEASELVKRALDHTINFDPGGGCG